MPMSLLPTAVLILVGAFLLADRLTWLMIRLAPRLGLIDHPGERRIHAKAVPRAGGIALYIALMGGLAVMWKSGLPAKYGSMLLRDNWVLWFGGSASLLAAVGVIDDRFNISAWWKLAAQAVAASLMFFGTQEQIGVLYGITLPWWIDLGVYVLWVVALVNAFNLIDGMDGLCAGLGLISVGILCLLAGVGPAKGDALMLSVMCVCLLAFLRFNFHPAKIFLGDTGSMLIGFFVATVGGETVGRHAVVAGILLPLLVAGIPLFDVLLAVWRRGMRRFSHSGPAEDGPRIFGADKDHLHHRLMLWGLSQRQAAGLIYALAAVLSILALAPMLGGGNLLAFSLMGLVLVGLVGLRYLAPVEFIESGHGLRAFLRKPAHRSVMILAYFLYDLIALTFAVWFSMFLVSRAIGMLFSKKETLMVVSLFVGCCLVSLRFAHAHTRRWSRAGLNDFFDAAIWLTVGMLLSGGLVSVFLEDLSYRMILIHLGGLAFSIVGVLAPRCLSRMVQEGAIDSLHRRRTRGASTRRNTLLYGAGDTGELFLCHLRLSPPSKWAPYSILGFIDDHSRLKGRRVRGFPVFGGRDVLERMVRTRKVECIILTSGRFSEETHREIQEFASRLGVTLMEWNPDLELAELTWGGPTDRDARDPDS
jgi:UDP-GlcNAc:undecaprenyl-phosphate GlcNAc-1-phosphate transferase